MTIMDNHSRSSNHKQFLDIIHRGAFRPVIVLAGVFGFALMLVCSVPHYVHAASDQSSLAQKTDVIVFAAPDESSSLVETIRDGESLSPMGEMTGPGGLKWFMVKTRNGNVGWIKAGDNAAVRKIDVHFRSLPNEVTLIGPGGAPDSTVISSKTSATGAITIPIRIERRKVLVPVTLTNGLGSATGNLVVDTGASRTMISKRLARDLRLLAIDTHSGKGIGVSFVADDGQVESVKVGAAEVKNMRVSIHDGSNALGGEGLLGFDFLGRFQMSLDTDKKVMVLTPRKQ